MLICKGAGLQAEYGITGLGHFITDDRDWQAYSLHEGNPRSSTAYPGNSIQCI